MAIRALPTRPSPGHPLAFRVPFYAGPDAAPGLRLHQYQDTEFIPRFLTDLGAGRLGDPLAADWWRADRFSRHGDELVLRLPTHRTFYLVVCELVCDRPGAPALDPARIRSAGFVIRRRAGAAPPQGTRRGPPARARLVADSVRGMGGVGSLPAPTAGAPGEARWMVEDGEPLGWQFTAPEPSGSSGADPDPARRLAARGRAPRAPAYTGEETHPLHPVLASDGAGRTHTILYGFLPLGGQSLPLAAPFDEAAEADAVAADRARLRWPFGYLGRSGLNWQAADGVQVTDGVPTPACFELLELLVNRYHVGEAGRAGADPLNADLAAAAAELRFAELVISRTDGPYGTPLVIPLEIPRFTLAEYLSACFAAGIDNPLAAWLAARRRVIDAAGGTPTAALIGRLPRRPGDGPGELTGMLLRLTSAGAEAWRLALGQRLLDQARRTGAELPIPKFRQGPDDVYRLIPFVRVLDDGGCERLTWAGPAMHSVPFRVAAAFDPDASRPVLIQMPGLRDLKRGLARGAAMLVPSDTARLLDGLKLDKGASPDLAAEPPPPGSDDGLGVQWLCSFSLPIITLVAMILLMIMVVLLNLLFFWLPWVKICLPFPRLK